MLVAASTVGNTFAQSVTKSMPVSNACALLQQAVTARVANGKLNEAEQAVSAFLNAGDDDARNTCAGLVLNNIASFMLVTGRIADAERSAERSVMLLEKAYDSNDVVLLRPLQVLAAARLEQGKTAKAREASKRIQSIRIHRPEDSALVHATAAVLLEAEGRWPPSEAEYLAALHALEEAGLGEAADAGAVLNALGSVYLQERRLTEARQALDRALDIFSRAKDTVPMDRIKLLHLRGVLYARQGDWRKAEQDLRDALSMVDLEPG